MLEFAILQQGQSASLASDATRGYGKIAENIGKTYNVFAHSRFGKGVTREQRNGQLRTLSLRFSGAIVLGSSYEFFRDIVIAQITADSAELQYYDFKSELQYHLEALHLGVPRYLLITEDGPDHKKLFTVKVAVGSREAVGVGRSKKLAEREAARSYIAQYAHHLASPHPLSNKARACSIKYSASADMKVRSASPEALAKAGRLCGHWNVLGLNREAVAISLTNDDKTYQTNASFRVLGAALEEFACALHLYDMFGSELPRGVSAREVVTFLARVDPQISLFDALSLGKFVVAQDSDRQLPSMKVGVVKALLVPIYLAKGSLAVFLRTMQDYLGIPLTNLLSDTVANRPDYDPKSTLQRFCQMVPDLKVRYQTSGSGPDHRRLFSTSLYLDLIKPSQKEIAAGKGLTAHDAERESAKRALAIITPSKSVDRQANLIRHVFWRTILLRLIKQRTARLSDGLGIEEFQCLNVVSAFARINEFCSDLPKLVNELGVEKIAELVVRSVGPLAPFRSGPVRECALEGIDLLTSIHPDTIDRFISAEVAEWLDRLRSTVAKVKLPPEPIFDSEPSVALRDVLFTRFANLTIETCDEDASISETVFSHFIDVLEAIDERPSECRRSISVELRNSHLQPQLHLRIGGQCDLRAMYRIQVALAGGAFFRCCSDSIERINDAPVYVIRMLPPNCAPEALRLFACVMRSLLDREQWVGILHRLVHDLKNQVLTLRSQAEQAFRSGSSSYELFAQLERIQNEIRQKRTALVAFLDVGDIAGDSTCNPREIIRAVALNQLTALPSNINFSFAEEILCKTMKIDGELLASMLTNLVKNAVDAMPNGGKLAVTSSSDDSSLWIEVKDTGCGIEKDRISLLFSDMRSTKGGMGLGLATVKRIVGMYGGIVDVESEVGVGTTFAIALPLRKESVK
jgi:dsRNA-specific ribonuclease